MKNNILRVCLLVCLFVNAFAYAEPLDPTATGDTPTEDTYEPESFGTGQENLQGPVPINSNMYILAAAGVIVGAYFFNKKQLV